MKQRPTAKQKFVKKLWSILGLFLTSTSIFMGVLLNEPGFDGWKVTLVWIAAFGWYTIANIVEYFEERKWDEQD